MAKLSANGTEFARFEKRFAQDDLSTLVVQHSVRLKVFKTKPAEVVIMRKVRTFWPGSWDTGWSSWKLQATARTRLGALKWHDARDWTQLSGETERED